MTFEEFKTQVQARWPTKRWRVKENATVYSAHSRVLHVGWIRGLGWTIWETSQARGATLPNAIRNARNAINRARKALDKEPTP